VALISSSLKGAPWEPQSPSMVTEPLAMVVSPMIMDGREVSALAASMAARMAAWSWPSISMTCQPMLVKSLA